MLSANLTQRLAAKVPNFLEDRSVSAGTEPESDDANRLLERIAIARALLRNPKVLLLDEVCILPQRYINCELTLLV